MIRWKVFLPVVALVILVSWLVVWRLDFWVRKGLEDAISAATGTKTDISGLRITFKNSSLVIRRLEIASPTQEFKNAVEFGDIVINFQFLPLLEKRVVIDEFSIRGIDWGTTRKTSGFLPPKPKSKEPSVFSEWIDTAFAEVKQEFNDLPVAKLVDFQVPTNPQEILGLLDLQSEKAFKEAVVKFQESQGVWTKKVRELRDVSEYERFIKQARALTKNLPQDPQEILKRVEESQRILKFFEEQKEEAESLVKGVRDEFKNLSTVYQDAVGAIQADYEKARSLVSLDQFKVDNLSRLIFGQHWVDRLEMVLKYQAKLREIQAKLKAEEDEEVRVQPRAKGRDIVFITKKRLPSFVLANSEFSVEGLVREQAGRLSQRYEAKIEDLNSDPKLWGKPTRVHLGGQFKEALISRADVDLFWDYTKEKAVDRYTASVQRLKAEQWPVGIPNVFPLKIESGFANVKTNLEFDGSDMKWINRMEFSNVKWDLKEVPRIGFIIRTLSDVISRIQSFELEIELRRAEKKFAFRVRSNLDDLFRDSIEQEIRGTLAEFQKKLKAEIEKKVQAYQDQAMKELKKYQNLVQDQAENRLSKVLDYQKEVEKQIKDLQNKAKKQAESKVKDAIKKPLKNLKVPKLKSPL